MKLIGSLLVATAFGGIWNGKRSDVPRTGSGLKSVVDHIMSGSAVDHIASGFEGRSPRPMPGRSGSAHRSESPESGRRSGKGSGRSGSGRRSGPGPKSGHHAGEKDVKGCTNCGSTMNSNYAPVNTNVQNFVNIETEIETNININGGGDGGGHGGHHFVPNRPQHDIEEVTDEWGWPIWDGEGETHDNDNAEETPEFGYPVWDGGEDWEDHESDPTLDQLLQVVRGKLGLNTPSDMMARLDKDEVKTLLTNFLHTLKQDNDFDHEHVDHHKDHESGDNESGGHTNKPGTDATATPRTNSPGTTGKPVATTTASAVDPIDNESGSKPKSPVDNES